MPIRRYRAERACRLPDPISVARNRSRPHLESGRVRQFRSCRRPVRGPAPTCTGPTAHAAGRRACAPDDLRTDPGPRKNKTLFSPSRKPACGESCCQSRESSVKTRGIAGIGPFIGFKRPISAQFCRLRERRPSGIVGFKAKPNGRELECAIRPLGTGRVAAPVIWAVRGRQRTAFTDVR